MKIGILTFHHTTNFGATLQAYALSSFLRQNGHYVEFINYQPKEAVKVYRDTLYKKARKSEILHNFIRELKMQFFVSRKMKVGNKIYHTHESLRKFNIHYDAVIVGSDEVWNINSFRGVDTSFFLDFLPPETKKISYAASFGGTTTLGDCQSEIRKMISDFSHVSVRDSNSIKLLNKECQIDALRVLDPTFLIDYKNLTRQDKKKRDYILIYGKPQEDMMGYIRDLSDKLRIPVVSVGYANSKADINRVAISPAEWLTYFSQARHIFTSFYHGTIFSILFRKPFTVFSAQKKVIKLRDLLDDLGLSNRIHSEIPNEQPDFSAIDYEAVFREVQRKRQTSRQYLMEALRNDRD